MVTKSYDVLYDLWSRRQELGLVPVLDEINRLLEQGVVSVGEFAKVKAEAAKTVEKTATKRKTSNKKQRGKASKEFNDWSPASVFGMNQSEPKLSNQQSSTETESSRVKRTALRNYGAELFQRAWFCMRYRHHITDLLANRPFSKFTKAVKQLQLKWRKWRRSISDAATLIISSCRMYLCRKRYTSSKNILRRFSFKVYQVSRNKTVDTILRSITERSFTAYNNRRDAAQKVQQYVTRFLRAKRLWYRHSAQRSIRRCFVRYKLTTVLHERAIARHTLHNWISNLICNYKQHKRTKAQQKIQRWLRSRLFNMRVKQRGKMLLQFYNVQSRFELLANQLIKHDQYSRTIQCWYTRIKLARKLQNLAHLINRQGRSSVKLQTRWRCYRCTSRFNLQMSGFSKLQCLVRKHQSQRSRVATKLQQFWKKQLSQMRRKVQRKVIYNWQTIAAKLFKQNKYRIVKVVARRVKARPKASAIVIQKWYKRYKQQEQSTNTSTHPARLDSPADVPPVRIVKTKPLAYKGPLNYKFYCPAFLKHGNCSRGDTCRFAHVSTDSTPQRPQHGPGAGRLYRGAGSSMGNNSERPPKAGQQTWLQPTWNVARQEPRKVPSFNNQSSRTEQQQFPSAPPKKHRKPKLAYTHLNRTIRRSNHLSQHGHVQRIFQYQSNGYSRFPDIVSK